MEGNRFFIKPGIRRSVVMHYFIVVFLTMLILEIIFMLAVRTYYYDSVSNHLKYHASATSSYYQRYVSILYSEDDRTWLPELLKLFHLEKAEVQILDKNGNVLISSSGFQISDVIKTSDVITASQDLKTTRWVGKQIGTGETVMSLATPLMGKGDIQYILRLVTSMETVNSRLNNIVLLSIVVSISVLVLVLIVSFGLANSIVSPINEITAASAQMARGRFDIKVKEGYKYELGDLAKTLNFMAHEIVRSNELKNDFISSISHELRTPLTGIKGWSETLQSGSMTDQEEMKLGLNIITKETDRLIGLVEELLDFSKLQQDRLQLHWQPVKLHSLLEETLFQVKMKADQKDITLKLEHSESFHSECELYGDTNRLKQVFLNLIDNAIKFSPLHSTITVRLEWNDQQCEVRVIDQGIGISEDHLTKVMDKFYQVNPDRGGTGLGLAITDEIIKVHGGEMTILSEAGQGTTVLVSLPSRHEPPVAMNRTSI
ncbi:HAMP domain-containing histidine kinase [Paenibacillus sp. ACRRX]|uniref:HAMP domain-containing sensor histidine kinase n=1 Tax=unclassified Paenibacillus TaxID=185978 RepID=UPI001EF5D595|nr:MULTISPECIES: HAMP domain-containing sensor histidine kinase [unclassified Paenibacillus]MCG7407123.1 HAMP domain-containing histidine kinase [Paenibacillus sp. ACRRX]MDK8180343.1 HAMP domain-containing sensor histidine kinase [Paenibacillus sp. UMB4589-SE434]